MAIDKSHPMRFTAKGLSDAYDSSDVFPGACQSLQNLIFDQSNPEIIIARPGVKRYVNFMTSGFTNPGYISVHVVIGTRIYGMISSGLNSGKDQPFIYETSSGTFVTITGITGPKCPASPATTGDWIPPTIANIGTMVIVTHPGFSATANKFGWFDITNPAAPTWNAGDTLTNALTAIPTAVANYNNRAYFAVGNQLQFTDVLTNPPTRTNANQALVIGDSVAINALAGLPVQTTSSGVVQALYIFKPSQVWQVTGDPTFVSGLFQNFVSLTIGTSMPRSVALSTTGLYFMAVGGPYFIDALGSLRALTHSAQETNPDVQVPFQSAQTPTRWAGAYGSSMYRICGPTVIKGVQTTNDYWFDEHRRRWIGPHSYGYDCASPILSDFIVSSAFNPGTIGRSQTIPDSTSIYTDLDSVFQCGALSCTFPKTGDMFNKQVVESTIELEASLGLTAYTVQAQNEQGVIMGTVIMQAGFGGNKWGSFIWGDGTLWSASIIWGGGALWGSTAQYGSNQIWRSGQQIPSTYPVSWAAPLVFDKMQLLVAAQASGQVGIGTFYARYQQTGYQTMNAIAISSQQGQTGTPATGTITAAAPIDSPYVIWKADTRLPDALILTAGTNITLGYSGGNVIVNSTGGGGGIGVNTTYLGNPVDTPANTIDFEGAGVTVISSPPGRSVVTITGAVPGLPVNAIQFNVGPGTFTGSANLLWDGAAVQLTGNLNMPGTGRQWTADWSNATLSLRAAITSNVTNGNTLVNVIPNGSATISGFQIYNASDYSNHSRLAIQARTTGHVLNSVNIGTGVAQPVILQINGSNVVSALTSLVTQVAQGFSSNVRTVSSGSTTLTFNDSIVFADATAGNVTITLPAANADGAGFSVSLRIKRIDSTANTFTISRAGADTIDGGTSLALGALQAADLESDGVSKWGVL